MNVRRVSSEYTIDPKADVGIRIFKPEKFAQPVTRLRTPWRVVFILVTIITMMATAYPLFGKEIVDRIVAVVNNEIVSLAEVKKRVAPYVEKIKKGTYTLTEQDKLIQKVWEEHLDLLIDEKLADQEIRRLKIKVSKKQIDQALDRFRSANKISMEELQSALTDQGRSLEDFREEIKAQILRARLVNREIRSKIVITDEEIAAYYKSHPEEFGAEKKYRLRNIVVAAPQLQIQDEKDGASSQIERIYKRLVAGESFEALAREYSQASNAVDGGALGDISANMLAPDIRQAIELLQAGEFTPIIETDQGYQIFYLEAVVSESAAPFEKVKVRIEDTLYNQIVDKKYKNWLRDLRARAHIKLIK